MITVTGQRDDDEPRYRWLANTLRQRIADGYLLPGQAIPSESQLIEQFEVSRNTARDAVKLLRREGVIYTEHGRASFVRPTYNRLELRPQRYMPGGVDIPPQMRPEYAIEVGEATADRGLSELLAVDEGEPLLHRRTLVRMLGLPYQICHSYFRRDLVAGTPLVDPAGPFGSRLDIDRFAALGVTVTAVEEQVGGRRPTEAEAKALMIVEGGDVLTITRRMFAGETPVEAAYSIVVPADRVSIRYRFDLPRP